MAGFLEDLLSSVEPALHALANPPRAPLEIDPAAKGFHAGGPGLPGFTASKVPFSKFDEKFIGSGVGHNYNGYGFYLTGNKGYATAVRDQYHQGGAVQEAKISPGKMFDLDAKSVDPSIIAKIEKFTGQPLDRFSRGGRDVLNQLENVPVTAYRALFQDPTISTSQQGASKFLSAAGYKGNTYSDSYGEHYVIYNSKDLEVVGK